MMINHFAVIAAAISDFVIGALWFSPILFYKSWLKETGLTEELLKKGNPLVTYGLTFILALLISYNLAFFLAEPSTDAMWGLTAGFLAGVWAAAGFSIIGLFLSLMGNLKLNAAEIARLAEESEKASVETPVCR